MDYNKLIVNFMFDNNTVPSSCLAVVVMIFEDLLIEGDEVFSLAISNADPFVLVPMTSATVIIQDNDCKFIKNHQNKVSGSHASEANKYYCRWIDRYVTCNKRIVQTQRVHAVFQLSVRGRIEWGCSYQLMLYGLDSKKKKRREGWCYYTYRCQVGYEQGEVIM